MALIPADYPTGHTVSLESGKVASRLVSRSKVRLSPVLVSCPLKLGGVGLTCAHVLGLQMLHLREDVEPACAVCSRHFDK